MARGCAPARGGQWPRRHGAAPSDMTADLRWSGGDGLRLAFSSAADGDMRDAAARSAFLAAIGCPRRCVAPSQVHGALVVDAGDAGGLAAADGVATTDARLALAVFGADCPGLCL